jgi:hypothetical protein
LDLLFFVVAKQLSNIQLEDVSFLPFAYCMLQAIPFLMLEVSVIKQFKLMRNLNAKQILVQKVHLTMYRRLDALYNGLFVGLGYVFL